MALMTWGETEKAGISAQFGAFIKTSRSFDGLDTNDQKTFRTRGIGVGFACLPYMESFLPVCIQAIECTRDLYEAPMSVFSVFPSSPQSHLFIV